MNDRKVYSNKLLDSLIAGGIAGFCVDFTLYPLDTIKTRLQSQNGFLKSGGFLKLYNGLGFALIGSIPNAATFFLTYECSKSILFNQYNLNSSINHMIAASFGEITSCLIRMPIEVIKQKSQANSIKGFLILKNVYNELGLKGFYRGYITTISREIPFSLIQYPLWEFIKNKYCLLKKKKLEKIDSIICGAISGGISAYVTTPLDLAKTRIILAERKDKVVFKGNTFMVIKDIWLKKGVKGLFTGAIPRVIWISVGGGIFLGGFDIFKSILESL